jgi:hypothetical protein
MVESSNDIPYTRSTAPPDPERAILFLNQQSVKTMSDSNTEPRTANTNEPPDCAAVVLVELDEIM